MISVKKEIILVYKNTWWHSSSGFIELLNLLLEFRCGFLRPRNVL